MSILVTGGTGFIGAQVVRLLLNKGQKNIIAFHFTPGKKTLDDVSDQIELVRGDLGNFNHVLDVVKNFRPEKIFHLGAMLTLPSESDPSAAFKTNAMGIFHILEAARLFEVKQVLFASSVGSYGLDMRDGVLNDYTIQRPTNLYGITKVFGEHLGLFYKKKYGLDFRGIRYPGIVGPGFKTPSSVQYMSLLIEEIEKGNPFTIPLKPESKFPIMYFKDAALAMVMLGEAPLSDIRMVNYVLDGVTPTPSAGEMVNAIKAFVPKASIWFESEPEIQAIFDSFPPLDDGIARKEWGWRPEYNLEQLVKDFIGELQANPERYV